MQIGALRKRSISGVYLAFRLLYGHILKLEHLQELQGLCEHMLR